MKSSSHINLEFEKHYREMGFAAQRRYPNEQLIQFLASLYFKLDKDKRKNVKVLELGCGSGANLWMVAHEGFDTYGVDISQTGIELCEKMMGLWNTHATLSVGNMSKIDFKDSFFDCIFDVTSMQHTDLETHGLIYREIFRTLKKGGHFFSWHLGAQSITFREGGGKLIDKLTIDNAINLNVPLNNAGLTCFLTPAEARKMLQTAGFENICVEVFTRTYNQTTQTIEYLAISAQKK